MDIVSYVLARKFTEDTADSLGSLRGAPSTIKSITDIPGGHRVTFAWTGTSGTEQTATMDVMNGENAQVNTLPVAAADTKGKIYQYTGVSTADLINGYFYECVENGGIYVWAPKSVQETDEEITVSELPAASVDYLGKTLILTGMQTGYETGGVYKCSEPSAGVYRWDLINNDAEELSSAQVDALIALLD